MIEFKESKFYKLLQDFFINNDKETFLQMLAEFYNRTEGIINKNISQDELIKELHELYLEFNEKGIDENIVREKVNYFVENNVKIKDILAKLVINTNKIENNTEKLNTHASNIENINSQLDTTTNKIDNIKDIDIPYISKLIYKKDNKSWADSIQEYENEANNIYKSIGVKVRLKFPENEVIEIDKTIYKKSGVDWVGSCKIKRISSDTSNLWALVVANNQSDFIIDNISFENLGHEIAYKISSHWSVDIRNCCIHTYKCNDFTISNCNFTKYTEGIVNTGCKRYSIFNNNLNSNVIGKNISQFLDDSYIDIAGAQTGDITGWVLSEEANLYNEDFIISNNKCLSVGLRIGIEIMTQSATHARGIISNNIIKGLHHGIKLYKGTYGQLENAVTNVKQCIISNNQISYCREIGIYIRANLGVLCTSNFISYCGLKNTGAGTAFGGIVTRVSAEITDTNSSLDAGNFITNNYIYNCGKSTGTSVEPLCIHIRNASAKVSNNYIVQDSNYTTKTGSGILVGMGDNAQNSSITNNKIINFDTGVKIDNIGSNAYNLTSIKSNEVIDCNTGVFCQFANNIYNKAMIKDNNIYNANKGIIIRKALNTRIISNYIDRSVYGIDIQSGCFEDNNNRTNPTTIVFNNIIDNATTPHTVSETAVGDVTFAGRCKHWSNDLVDGVVKP